MKFASFLIAMLCTIGALAQNEIAINYSGNTATVNIPASITDVVCTSGTSSDVVLISTTALNEYTYKLTGTTTDGSLLITGSYKLTLELSGVSIASQSRYAINVDCGKRVAVVVDEGTVNSLSDAANGTHKGTLYFKGHPEFEGGGVLNVTGRTKHAIFAKEYIQFKKSLGTINVLSANGDAIHCNDKGQVEDNYFMMNGGVLNISNIEGDGIDTGTNGCATINGGSISMTVSGLDCKGIKADGDVVMNGGSLNLHIDGDDSKGISSKGAISLHSGTVFIVASGDGSKGLKGNVALGATEGGDIILDGANVDIYATGGIYESEEGTSECQAINAEGNYSHTIGLVNIYAYGSDLKGISVDGIQSINDEMFALHAAPWSFCPYDYRYDMTAYVTLMLNNEYVADPPRYAIAAFIGDECVGVADDGYLRIYSNSTSKSAVTFRAYDLISLVEYRLTSSVPVSFLSTSFVGTFSSPIVLSSLSLPGDVNQDGKISVSDLVGINAFLNGGSTEGLSFLNADIDPNGSITVTDALLLLDMILGK